MPKCYVICEGHGERAGALNNLLSRLWSDLDLSLGMYFPECIRVSGVAKVETLQRYAATIRNRPDADALLILRDEDDGCPATIGPAHSRVLRDLQLTIPAALVLAKREFESLFLASLSTLAGRDLPVAGPGGLVRPGIAADALHPGRPDERRGAKEWLSRNWSGGRRYKPTTDQLPLTRMVDFDIVRGAQLDWFHTLERALRFLDAEQRMAGIGRTYPPPA